MNLEYLNPTKLSPEMLSYALGQTNLFPAIIGIPRKQTIVMLRMRRAFIRNLLEQHATSAYRLPDFNELMSAEIWQYAKQKLRPLVFLNWESIIREAPRFRDIFSHESAKQYREYHEAVEANRSFINHRYLSILSKRKAFATAVSDPYILGEIEIACTGTTRYGLP